MPHRRLLPIVLVVLFASAAFCGAEVKLAESGLAALAVLGHFAADVVVSDISMGHMDGYEFIGEARARGLRAPAIALTAFAHEEDASRALGNGFQAHISKPVDVPTLFATVAALAGLRRHHESAACPLDSTEGL